jgi:hypothetical protein
MKERTRKMVESPWSLIAMGLVLALITEVIRRALWVPV